MSETSNRKVLGALLEQEKADPDRILELALKIAEESEDRVRFVSDASLVDRLGRELVGRAETAVSELVKNAYDADATKVKLTFVEASAPGASLIVEDDGCGMSRDQLIQGFMRLSTSMKRHQPQSTRFGRIRAGRKGIGRFAAQRLGTRLVVLTQTEHEDVAWKLTVDWNRLTSDSALLLNSVPIERSEKKRACGTTLRIEGLREAWSEFQIRRTFRNTLDLFHGDVAARRAGRDPGFEAEFWKSENGQQVLVASERQVVSEFALAHVTAIVESTGIAKWQIASSKLGLNDSGTLFDEKTHREQVFPELTAVASLSAQYFIWESGLVPASERAALRELADMRGGIRLYRNGFRVAPYGEPGDDWLKLDFESRRRGVLVPIANINWFGEVTVVDPVEHPRFEELSSREGLLREPAFDELVEFARKCLFASAIRIGHHREKKVRASTRRLATPSVDTSPMGLRELAAAVERGFDHRGEAASDPTNVVPQVLRVTADEKQQFLEERSMLRVLASLGTTIGEFTHELKHLFIPLQVTVAKVKEGSQKVSSLVEPASRLSEQVNALREYTSYFDKVASKTAQREVKPQDLSWLVHEFFGAFGRILEREQIDVDLEELDEGLVTRPMHEAEIFSLLANLLTNSIKAIKRSSRASRGVIRVAGSRLARDCVEILFTDNGDGIPPENVDKIFEAFFTTTGADDYLGGTGLGLKIVKDLLDAYDGSIELVSSRPSVMTTFRIIIPAGELGGGR
jgi:signal transduction histidine kinase